MGLIHMYIFTSYWRMREKLHTWIQVSNRFQGWQSQRFCIRAGWAKGWSGLGRGRYGRGVTFPKAPWSCTWKSKRGFNSLRIKAWIPGSSPAWSKNVMTSTYSRNRDSPPHWLWLSMPRCSVLPCYHFSQ